LSAHLSAAQIKARLDHPIIDADGHWIEYGPVFTEELRRVGGEDAVEGWNAVRNGTRSALSMSVEERRRRRISQEAFWGHPSKNTKDLATALFPRLLAERLDEIGLDFAIIYPTGACECRGSAPTSRGAQRPAPTTSSRPSISARSPTA
jgi:hypothetical protein